MRLKHNQPEHAGPISCHPFQQEVDDEHRALLGGARFDGPGSPSGTGVTCLHRGGSPSRAAKILSLPIGSRTALIADRQ